MPNRSKREDPKTVALVREGTLNPAPEEVSDPRFREGELFDPRDVAQVKYEMRRRVSVESVSVTAATVQYGALGKLTLDYAGDAMLTTALVLFVRA